MNQITGSPEPFEDEIETARNDSSWGLDDVVTIPGIRKWRYGPGGALTTNIPIDGITQILDEKSEKFYGYKHFVGESITRTASRLLAELLDPCCEVVEYYDYVPGGEF
jgi:hypothetical protein